MGIYLGDVPKLIGERIHTMVIDIKILKNEIEELRIETRVDTRTFINAGGILGKSYNKKVRELREKEIKLKELVVELEELNEIRNEVLINKENEKIDKAVSKYTKISNLFNKYINKISFK